MDALGKIVETRTQFHAANVTATLQPDGSVQVSANTDVTVPITGLALWGAETYGGQAISHIAVTATAPVTVGVPPVVTPPVVTPPGPVPPRLDPPKIQTVQQLIDAIIKAFQQAAAKSSVITKGAKH